MRLLKKLLLLVCISVAADSCAPTGSLTPNEAYSRLKRGVESRDGGAVADILSKESLGKIGRVSSMFAAMPPEQRESLARHYGVSEGRLARLQPEDYMDIVLSRDDDRNFLQQAFSSPLLSIDRVGNSAYIRFQSGISLLLVREGPYWKLDITGY